MKTDNLLALIDFEDLHDWLFKHKHKFNNKTSDVFIHIVYYLKFHNLVPEDKRFSFDGNSPTDPVLREIYHIIQSTGLKEILKQT